MPSGDAQRTWFPEMIVRLRSEWHEGISIPALIGLRDELDETLHRIRAGRNIQTPIITCRRCGKTGHAAEPRVSVRALILAVARFGIASKDQTRALEKAWAEYRKQQLLPYSTDAQDSEQLNRRGMMVRQSNNGSSVESKESVVYRTDQSVQSEIE